MIANELQHEEEMSSLKCGYTTGGGMKFPRSWVNGKK